MLCRSPSPFYEEKGDFLRGKNLKGKECGKGFSQRKDGKYTARFTPKNGGNRREKYFTPCLKQEIG